MDVELFDIHDAGRMAAAFAVRVPVFVDEQHVPAEEEIDEHDRTDADARHALVRDGDAPVAAGRYYRVDGTTAQVGRMAVLAAYRGRRHRAAVTRRAGRRRARARLHARRPSTRKITPSAFYAKAGFSPFGATLVECDILHQPMELLL